MATKIKKGIIDQVISRTVEPSICSAATPRRLRNLTANTIKVVKISSLMMAETSTRKM